MQRSSRMLLAVLREVSMPWDYGARSTYGKPTKYDTVNMPVDRAKLIYYVMRDLA